MLRQVVYVSAISPGTSKAVERNIVGMAKRNNRRSDLTGVIASSGTHFLQVLEGPNEAIRELLPKLMEDPRHRDVRILFDRPIELRRYASWSMGYLYSLDLADELEALHSGSSVMDPDAILLKFQPDELDDLMFSRSSFFGSLDTTSPVFPETKP